MRKKLWKIDEDQAVQYEKWVRGTTMQRKQWKMDEGLFSLDQRDDAYPGRDSCFVEWISD